MSYCIAEERDVVKAILYLKNNIFNKNTTRLRGIKIINPSLKGEKRENILLAGKLFQTGDGLGGLGSGDLGLLRFDQFKAGAFFIPFVDVFDTT